MSKFNLIKNFLAHQISGKNEHSLHSPFVFDIYLKAIKNKGPKIHDIEKIRKSLLNSNTIIEVQDFGAGSINSGNKNKRSIKSIAGSALSTEKQCQLLFRLVDYMKPKSILELGTSLGISTLYLSKSAPEARIYTIEGCSNIAEVARTNFEQLNVTNIQGRIGNINDALPSLLNELEDSLDMVFFDGNHRKQATLNYFEQCLTKASEETVFVFDDIYWSKGMQEAWELIQNHERVMISIDLFDFGLAFFRTNQPKQHFKLRW